MDIWEESAVLQKLIRSRTRWSLGKYVSLACSVIVVVTAGFTALGGASKMSYWFLTALAVAQIVDALYGMRLNREYEALVTRRIEIARMEGEAKAGQELVELYRMRLSQVAKTGDARPS